jgi:subtilisin family serine protease
MAIVLSAGERPLLEADRGHLAALNDFTTDLAASAVEAVIEATGRIELGGHQSFPWVGAALLVTPRLVVTARHAADLFLIQQGPSWVLDSRFEVSVAFGARLGDPPVAMVERCVLRHPVLNLAVLELAQDATAKPAILDGGPQIESAPAAVVLYYAEDPRNDPAMTRELGAFDAAQKIVAPGRVRGYGPAVGSGAWSIIHDCTTVGGGAGGPLIALETGRVIGLHFAGRFLEGNYAVPVSEMALDPRLRKLGLNFTPDSPAGDENAFEAEYLRDEEAGTSAASTATATPAATAANPFLLATPAALSENAVEQIGRQLADAFETLDEEIAYLESFGEEFAQTIRSQPGRSQLPAEQYRLAVLNALNRRGLLGSGFQESLLSLRQTGESVEETAIAEPLPDAAPADSSSLEPSQVAAFEELAASFEETGPRHWETVIAGSPFHHLFVDADNAVRPMPNLIRNFAERGDAHARDALAWLVRRLLPLSFLAEKLSPEARDQLARFSAPPDLAFADLGRPPDRLEWVGMDFFERGREAARSVCLMSMGGPRPAGSTGWLLAPDLVVTPAHLVGFTRDSSQSSFASAGELDVSLVSARFDGDTPDHPPLHVAITRVESLDNATDLMILRLAEPLTDRAPLQIQLDQPRGGPVASIQFPGLGSKAFSYAGGRLLGSDGDELMYSLATAPGCGGAPIMTQSWKVIATHSGAREIVGPDGAPYPVRFGTSVGAIVSRLRGSADPGALWRRIVGAQEALRSVDPSLLSLSPGESQQAIMELVDEDTELPPLDGLTILSRNGPHLVCRIDGPAAEALAQIQGVVAIEQSRPTVKSELRHSLPAVGLPIDRHGIDETGNEAIVAIIDDGLDPFHQAFMDKDGKSRIDLYWDLRSRDDAPVGQAVTFSNAGATLAAAYGVTTGTLYAGADFDDPAVLGPAVRKLLRQGVMHGTAVASVAAGRATGAQAQHFCGGIAPEAKLIVVRLDGGEAMTGSPAGYRMALDLIEKRATTLDLPVVVNISNGVSGGAHDGTAPVEMDCGRFVSKPWRVIVKSAGNERNEGRHAKFSVDQPTHTKVLRWESKPTTNPPRTGETDELEIWCGAFNRYEFILEDPDRGKSTPFPISKPNNEHLSTQNDLECNYERLSTDNRKKSRIVVRIKPGKKMAVQPGEWKLYIRPETFLGPDNMHAWLTEQRDRQLSFKADVETKCTITVPGTGLQTITVAAMDSREGLRVYEKGSMGPNADNVMKPDLIAPGAELLAALAGTDMDMMQKGESGTSFAAPHVTGAVALALSMARRVAREAGPAAAGWKVDQELVRELLLLSTPDFRPAGSIESGYGMLNIPQFLASVKDHLATM